MEREIKMEFYNEKLLTKGLPEIVAEFTPPDIYADLKVIVFPRKERKGLKGMAHDNDFYHEHNIKLWPSTICATPSQEKYRMPTSEFNGTYSFQLWRAQLFVALHEIGHLVTREEASWLSEEEYELRGPAYIYVERLADEFAFKSMLRIIEVDPRMGAPTGALTGYSGVLAYKARSGNFSTIDKDRISEWRALKCDAQIPLLEVVTQLWNDFYAYHEDYEYPVAYPIISRIVHTQAGRWNIGRYFTNRNGKKFLMFNIGEAQQIIETCKPICQGIKPKANLMTLYKRLGCLSEIEKDKNTLAWEKTTLETIATRIQRPFEGMPIEELWKSPDDIPF